ncbi:MAG: HPr family phosphocarrier protein [Oscillospiraceae bacterium]|nr:HPr family phosphocarrier protein [Oscillospiraceae bacterium]
MKEVSIKIPYIADVKKFVNTISKYEFDADVVSGRYSVDAKSIMGLFSLDLSKTLVLKIHTDDCDEFLTEIKDFIQ